MAKPIHSVFPRACRPEAYAAFATALRRLETTAGLWDAAVAVAQHALDDLDIAAIDRHLDDLAHQVRGPAHSSFQARWARLHQVLFEEEGFGGATDNYYSPLNSYPPVVLRTRRGLPITLALIYKVIAERVGIRVQGVNAPTHFLVRVEESRSKSVLIDPFGGGRVLTTDEALELISLRVGRPCDASCLQTATHTQWLVRILANLQHLFLAAGHDADLEAMNELALTLKYGR